ncbi:hypothetical protein [uncultured Croceitalea sp.]|uniref:hypothetical protein n=1 Tax=uncultured Croceitalea sp. TaxID=1798908 RepID=UPI00374FA10D
MESPVFEVSITGNFYSLLLPDDIIKPFLEKNLKRVKVKASFEERELWFHGAIQKEMEVII